MRFGFRYCWKLQRHPTNRTKTQNPIIKNGETRMWTDRGNPGTYHVAIVDTLKQEKHDEVTEPISTGRPVLVDQEKWASKLISENQDCHTQVVARSRTSPSSRACKKDRKSSSSRSTSCRLAGRITSTTHSAKIRRRWSANWVMWSYSSCAKLYQKYNVSTVTFTGIKELCTALADNARLTANRRRKFQHNYDWMHSLSRTTW